MRRSFLSPLSILACACSLSAGCASRDIAKAQPSAAEVAGNYELAKLKLESDLSRQVRLQNSTVTINSNHTAALVNIPKFDLSGYRLVCRLSGSADWQFSDQENGGLGWSVAFSNFVPTTKTNAECNTGYAAPSLLILGQNSPHPLYMIVGGSDSDSGLEFDKAGQ